ncbi:uncharacterized protein LOC124499952 isoform X2 [Dermatophagoides farinae]|uniref:uncharacterized protein LOC124499952 isoform X2 n=1 Tax=Dermatophagoides farinae TaxID=6954 RepID=UPI001F0E2C7C|nr:protein TFG-like isoform X2 [Dermatophagoides farinae]
MASNLNGKIIIKAQYVDDIRRIPIIGDEITYDELILMMQRLFKLQPTDEIHLKYRDDDNDLISIIDDNDLSFAIQYSRILKLKVFVNEKIAPGTGRTSMNNYKDICHELIEIRNRCNQLLEKMHLDGDKKSSNANNSNDSAILDTNEVHTQTDRNEKPQLEQPKIYGQPPKELDPLNNSNVSGVPKSEPTSQQQHQQQPQPQQHQQQSSTENKNVTSNEKSDNSNKQGFSPIAQQPVLQQAYPAPPVRPPVTNQYQQQQPPLQNPPPSSSEFSTTNNPQPYFQVPPPPTSSTGSYNPDPNAPSYHRHPMIPMPGSIPPPSTSYAGPATMSGPPPSFTPSGPSQPASGPSPSFMSFGGPTPPTSQPHHMMRPGQSMTPGHHGPPPGVPFNPPPPPMSNDASNKMPPSSTPMGMHGGPPPMPQLQSPPGTQPPPPQMGVDPSKQMQPPPMGPPPSNPAMGGMVPPPPMMAQFNPRSPGGFSYGAHLRTRYPTSG